MTKALALMSGGRDSLLAACTMIEDGFDLIPFFCDNGHIGDVDRVYGTIEAMDERYGTMCSTKSVIASTAMTTHKYMQSHLYLTSEELAQKYPHVQAYQLNCLSCRCAMYVHAIAYCNANGINVIGDGMRWCQGFFVDRSEFRLIITQICAENDIRFITPVYDITTNFDRKRKLCDRGMPTKTLEPQCFLGAELKGEVDQGQITSLENFFDKELRPQFNPDIAELIPIYKRH